MPYIPEHDRNMRTRDFPQTAGELNYAITRLIQEFLDRQGKPGYRDFNEVVGVLECCKLEFYRRAVAAYEDEKIAENGDVYPENENHCAYEHQPYCEHMRTQ